MEILQAIVMGLVQGLTEFIPISSTAHLRIVPALLGWPDFGAAFTAVIQLGTLVAVFAYFRQRIGRMVVGLLDAASRRTLNADARLALYIGAGTVPIGIVGVTLKKFIEGEARSLYVISGTLIVVALVLVVADRLARCNRGVEDVTLRDALIVGLAQACAVVPGVSRSGATLIAALLVGFRRKDAGDFSFLLSIPAITGAGLFEMKTALKAGAGGSSALTLAVATVVALVSGYASIAWLMKFLEKHTMKLFVVYRIALGVLLLVLLSASVLRPLQ